MRTRILFFSTLVAALTALAPASLAQEQADAITEINGQTLTTDAADVYFNAENCADQATTVFDLTLTNGAGVTRAYLWAGIENASCEQETNRTNETDRCEEIAGSPFTVGDNTTIPGLTLEALVNTGIVDCENTALEGQPFTIYAFRNEAPGSGDVAVEGYGVAPFIVDVTPPDELNITSASVQEGSTFEVTWSSPADSQSIARYNLYASETDDAAAAEAGGVQATAGQNATSVSVAAPDLGMDPGDEIYIFVSAVDFAAVNVGDGNEGPLSVSTLGIAAATAGFCDDPNVDCSGCSVSPIVLSNGQASSGLWVIGLVFAIVLGWSLRR